MRSNGHLTYNILSSVQFDWKSLGQTLLTNFLEDAATRKMNGVDTGLARWVEHGSTDHIRQLVWSMHVQCQVCVLAKEGHTC